MRRYYTDGVSYESGSINKQNGGTTVGKNGVVRARTIPTNPQTVVQQAIRAMFRKFTAGWSSLSEESRTAWLAAWGQAQYYVPDPRSGVSRRLGSAKDLFIKMNMNYNIAQGTTESPTTQFNTPGEPAGTDEITAVAVAADASDGTVALSFTGTWTDEAGIFRATDPVSAGTSRRTSVNSRFRVVDAPIDSTSPVALGSAYEAIFGKIDTSAGKKIFWQLDAVDLGTGIMRTVASGVTIIAA